MKNKKAGIETGWHKTWDLPMPECHALAGVIRRHRERRGWTLAKLAEESGVSRQMLGFLEDDQRKPTWDTTERIAIAFGIPHYQLALDTFRWQKRQPACCRRCHFSCVHRGEAKWLNEARQCKRPQTATPASPASLPDGKM